ncbi:hypothetical protein AB1Y20_000675 [Prymnesium parvum]|uniref:FYVE-type domain-containing protein n=1 Tax=Prymnesium parvum TaxID=97485 RepID=A0AB34K5H7_PRYPA
MEAASGTRCFDCDEECSADAWASLSYGVHLCLRCAGVHRSFGVHISYVRSCALDEWSEAQRAVMRRLGNDAFETFLLSHGVPRRVWLVIPLETRYFTPAADLYRRRAQEMAKGAVDGLPTDIRPEVRPPLPVLQKAVGKWTDDADAPRCQLCRHDFDFFNRRHHCRKCGRCVCNECSPPESFRPLPQLGHPDPVRQCKLCVPPPAKLMVGMGSSSSLIS